jgi:hypothetical protein
MNPWEWFKFLYENTSLHRYPPVAAGIFVFVSGTLGWLLWWRLDVQYRKDHPTVAAATLPLQPSAQPVPTDGLKSELPNVERPALPLTAKAHEHAVKPEQVTTRKESQKMPGDRSVKIGSGNQFTNSPIITGDIALNAERVLSQASGQKIVEVLSKFAPQEIVITAFMSAEDGQSYGAHLGSAIIGGGWRVRGDAVNRAIATVADQIKGLAVLVKDAANPPESAKQLQSALAAAGLAAPGLQDPSLADKDVVLWIGRR